MSFTHTGCRHSTSAQTNAGSTTSFALTLLSPSPRKDGSEWLWSLAVFVCGFSHGWKDISISLDSSINPSFQQKFWDQAAFPTFSPGVDPGPTGSGPGVMWVLGVWPTLGASTNLVLAGQVASGGVNNFTQNAGITLGTFSSIDDLNNAPSVGFASPAGSGSGNGSVVTASSSRISFIAGTSGGGLVTSVCLADDTISGYSITDATGSPWLPGPGQEGDISTTPGHPMRFNPNYVPFGFNLGAASLAVSADLRKYVWVVFSALPQSDVHSGGSMNGLDVVSGVFPNVYTPPGVFTHPVGQPPTKLNYLDIDGPGMAIALRRSHGTDHTNPIYGAGTGGGGVSVINP